MSTIDLLDVAGKKRGTVDLPDDLFNTTTNIPLIHQVVTAQLAAARQGTHSTKTRGDVSGGGRKPWRQKGTGRSRHGSRRSPIWVGGGAAHGPHPRSYRQKTPKQMVQAALFGVLSDRAREGRVFVMEAIVSGDEPSTKQAAAALEVFVEHTNLLVVLDRDDAIGWLSLRNLPLVHVIAADQLNAYDVVVSDAVIFTGTAIEAFAAAKGSTVEIKKTAARKASAKKADDTSAKKADASAKQAEAADEAEAEDKPAKKPTAAAKKAEAADESEAETEDKPAKKPAAKKADDASAKKPAKADTEPEEPAKAEEPAEEETK